MQELPQVPQFLGSLVTSTQPPLQQGALGVEQAVPAGAVVVVHAWFTHVATVHSWVLVGQSVSALQARHTPLPSQTFPPLSLQVVPSCASVVPQQPAMHVSVTHAVLWVGQSEACAQVAVQPLDEELLLVEDDDVEEAEDDEDVDEEDDEDPEALDEEVVEELDDAALEVDELEVEEDVDDDDDDEPPDPEDDAADEDEDDTEVDDALAAELWELPQSQGPHVASTRHSWPP
jgi:hypothetical protein